MKSVLLGMPGYGEMTVGASRGFWRSSRGLSAKVPLEVSVEYAASSSLTQNFNGLWCIALNRVYHGKGCDYFAMLHTDVEPEDYWLDTMIAELEKHKLDVLSAVIPIKDQKGITSTALARDDGDPWRPMCRLSMNEVCRLPETFTEKDVGHPLLLNTGCWVCKFNFEWAQKISFDINNRIVFSEPKKMYFAQFEPEDWHVSRQFHALGLKIGATRCVGLNHVGEVRFVNAHPWGHQKFDKEYVPESMLPAKDADGFKFPRDVDGWLLYEEGKALWQIARGKRILEVGSYCGLSTICMAQSATSITCIDPLDGRATDRPQDTSPTILRNLVRHGVNGKVTVIQDTFDGWFTKSYGPHRFDLVFIDGDHAIEAVRRDIEIASQVLEPDGLLVFHDYREFPGQHDSRWDPGVTGAVNELIGRGGMMIARNKTLAVVRPALTALQEA